jgi:hypothetical protein
MTMLTIFAPPARQAVIRAGLLASEGGTSRLSDGYLLLALAESEPLTSPVDLGVSAAMVRAQLEPQARRRHDRDLLATLGIDLDEVRRRVLDATATRLDDPARWRLRRSPVRPLRVTLTGPAAQIILNEGGRKAIEVARWASRRGRRTQIVREDLLWGLLADASSESVRILRRGQVDLGRLWTDLRRWHQSASGHPGRTLGSCGGA